MDGARNLSPFGRRILLMFLLYLHFREAVKRWHWVKPAPHYHWIGRQP